MDLQELLAKMTAKGGAVECRRMSCPPLECPPDALPVHVDSQCCKVCKAKCIYGGKVLAEGQRVLTKSCRECRNGVLVKVTETCPPLNCSEKDHVLPENQCCSVCRVHVGDCWVLGFVAICEFLVFVVVETEAFY
ncbi:hypothetical protein EK904_012485 [Melospiza melodia maxima]|nr:hypothetical protein EK904_012485 [Melospiza melodia maxima]